jgi:glycosyltransferase involved in cell wall biosynthesis
MSLSDLTVAVVVPTKDRADSLGRLLDALQGQTRPPDQVVVVNDGSRDSTAELLAGRTAAGHPLTVVVASSSRGPAAARNLGVQAVEADVVAFTDDDCQPAADWLERLLGGIQGGADLVLGRTGADKIAYAARGPWDHFMVTSGSDPMFSTCNIAYRRAWLERLEGFDESFSASRGGAQWGEDTDLGLRAVDAGATVTFEGSAVVLHDVVSRTWQRYLLAGLRRQGVPYLISKHPACRDTLYAGVFLNQAHAWAPLALIGVGGGLTLVSSAPAIGLGVAVAGTLPWLRFRTRVWPVHARLRSLPYVLPMLWVADLAETVFVVVAAGRSRVLVV